MRFELSPEQDDLLRETRKFLVSTSEAEHSAVLEGRDPFDPNAWQRAAAELGLAGIALDEALGGAGGTVLDLAVVLQASGEALTCLPLLPVATSGWLVAAATAPAEASATVSEFLVSVAAGSALPTWTDPHAAATLTARADGEEWHLDGEVPHVIAGPWATDIVVAATTDEGARLFRVDAVGAGVALAPEEALDPTRALATLRLSAAAGTPLGGAMTEHHVERLRGGLGVLVAAEQVGVAQAALDQAVEYARTRHQFGRPIGSFQALKHLLADLYVDVEVARDTVRYAAWALSTASDQGDCGGTTDDPNLLAHLTRSAVSPRADRVCAGNLQVLGGIGYTWEHTAHLFYKRSLTSSRLLGTVIEHLDVIADAHALAQTR